MATDVPEKIVVDTSALLQFDDLLDSLVVDYNVVLSIVTIEELDGLKRNRDPNVSSKTRKIIKDIYKYIDIISFDISQDVDTELDSGNRINDNIILSCAKRNNAKLFTEDLNLKIKAKVINIDIFEDYIEQEKYTGYKEVVLTDEQMANFYSNLNINTFDCKTNEYLVIKNSNEENVEIRKWNGESFVEIYTRKLNTSFFGDVEPKDIYQAMAIDSIMANTMTAISGKAGSGKSFISLICAMRLIENHKYSRLTIAFNPTKTRGAADMGYYPGTQLEKAMQSNIGQMLSSKFVSPDVVQGLIDNNQLRLISMADLRGMEIPGTDILYITEAQNTSVDLIKLCLSRAGDGCKVIIEGDYTAQVDNFHFENNNNGMKRVVDKLSGEKLFGYIELQNIFRSELAKLVDSL